MPRISVITASWNFAAFIERALRSVADQGWPDYEHIVVDNCSTDATAEIVRRFPNVRFISEPDRGQSDAINKGFRAATGDLIAWLNADEFYGPGVFSTVADEFSRDAKLDVFYGDTMLLDADGRPSRKRGAYPFDHSLLLYFGCFMHTCSTFWRRRFIDEGLLLDESLHYHMDHDFFLKQARAGYRFLYSPRIFGHFCVHDAGKTSNPATMGKRLAERRRIQTMYCQRFFPHDRLNQLAYAIILRFYALKTLRARITQRVLPPKV